MRLYVRSVVENHREDPQLLRVMMEQGPRAPELLERVAHSEQRRIACARRLLRNHPDVRVTDVDIAARLVTSTVEVVHRVMAGPARSTSRGSRTNSSPCSPAIWRAAHRRRPGADARSVRTGAPRPPAAANPLPGGGCPPPPSQIVGSPSICRDRWPELS
ncbi:hypothetical protein ACFWFI_39435 [Streptomyces sp. NPDC060209]|uniref:hypothetical protein n=1 Tax=Streptomyces sp. NPDC060209 TaxID=3347073 RepID=UPI00365D09B6